MRIHSIIISNWRSIRSTRLCCNDLTMLIGKNNHGKSNLLFALLYFCGKIEPTQSDFFDEKLPIEITVEFGALTPEEESVFAANGETLAITKSTVADSLQTNWHSNGRQMSAESLGSLQRIFENTVFVPASRQSPEAMNHKGEKPFFQLLCALIGDLSGLPVELDRTYPEFVNNDGSPHDTSVLPLLKEVVSVLDGEMEAWGTRIRLHSRHRDGKLQLGASIGIDDGVDTKRKGHGLERALIFAALRTWMILLTKRESSTALSRPFLLLFEEPELFLHPQAQKELHFAFRTIAETGVQIFFATHSSFFVDLSQYKSICIVQRPNATIGTKVHQYLEDIFELNEDIRNFNMNYWINPDRGELFFAKKVILAEGPTEKVILPKLAKKAGIFHYEYTIIDCSGKSNMPMYITLLNKFRIPYVVAYDSDQHKYRSRHSRETARMHSQTIESQIDPELGSSVIFDNDIEEELDMLEKEKKNKPFTALQYIADPHFEISESFLEKLFQLYD